ncbi:uncharacterized protein LOC125555777 isoform X2 [Triticum urartu]|uniref:uncharacterized protein LOC125555777 isoform X2 n=1 Tax=Triticum urartu TaxID=4572 RepID=UPI002044A356|nr:uncharacterized protein LOC125555777 isoform X2 [Triticum urartu]
MWSQCLRPSPPPPLLPPPATGGRGGAWQPSRPPWPGLSTCRPSRGLPDAYKTCLATPRTLIPSFFFLVSLPRSEPRPSSAVVIVASIPRPPCFSLARKMSRRNVVLCYFVCTTRSTLGSTCDAPHACSLRGRMPWQPCRSARLATPTASGHVHDALYDGVQEPDATVDDDYYYS